MSGEGQILVGNVGHRAIRRAGWRPRSVGGLTLGADPIAYAIAAHSTRAGEPLDAFTVRKKPKGHGAGRRIEGVLSPGDQVVVIEDSVTTGGSLLEAVDAARAHGCEVLGALALVDRDEGGAERLARADCRLIALYTAADLLGADPDARGRTERLEPEG